MFVYEYIHVFIRTHINSLHAHAQTRFQTQNLQLYAGAHMCAGA